MQNFVNPHGEPGKTCVQLFPSIAQAKWDNILSGVYYLHEDGTYHVDLVSKVGVAITYTDFNTLTAGSSIRYLNGGLIYVKKDNSTTWTTYTGA